MKDVLFMKKSKYNHFFPYTNEKAIAYNAMTNSLALLDVEQAEILNDCTLNVDDIDDSFIGELKKGGFVIESNYDEHEALRYRMLRQRYNTDSFALTLMPTNACNFACAYCFEKGTFSNMYMSKDVQDGIIEILSRKKLTISSFFVTWFGGEPLMALDIIESLTKRFVEICTENNITYSSTMITNGYFLTKENLERMNKLHINSIQVTVDGLEETHDKLRPHIDGSGTFNIIMQNLKDGYELLPPTGLRINIDKNNSTVGDDIYAYFKKHGMLDKIRLHYGKIMNDTNTHIESACLHTCDFSEIDYNFKASMTGAGVKMFNLPTPKGNFCGADSQNTYLIDAGGDMYKCWSEAGQKHFKICNLSDTKFDEKQIYKYLLYDPTVDENCSDCTVLPLCMGGCPFKRVVGTADKCINEKYILEKILDSVTNLIIAERMKNQEESLVSSND